MRKSRRESDHSPCTPASLQLPPPPALDPERSSRCPDPAEASCVRSEWDGLGQMVCSTLLPFPFFPSSRLLRLHLPPVGAPLSAHVATHQQPAASCAQSLTNALLTWRHCSALPLEPRGGWQWQAAGRQRQKVGFECRARCCSCPLPAPAQGHPLLRAPPLPRAHPTAPPVSCAAGQQAWWMVCG